MTAPSLGRGVMASVEKHAFSDTRREVGGVLIGTFGESSVEVTAVLPALKATGGQTHVTFTHEVWDGIHKAIDDDYPGTKIVGWYHTHPGFGLFLSDYDIFIHENFFSDKRMVALVIDPLAGTHGWFTWVGDRIDLSEQGMTVTPAVGAAPAPDRPTPAGRRRLAASTIPMVAALALATAIGGYTLGSHDTDSSSFASSSDAERTVEDTQQMQQELDATRARVQTMAERSARLRERLASLRVRSTTQEARPYFRYRVHSGDTLWAIAAFMYGDGRLYPRLIVANPDLDGRSDLDTGQTILIPLTAPGRDAQDG